jgi:hypothetical protein
MKSASRILLLTMLALTLACAIPASGQGICRGSFTLPHEVQWQSSALPAGVYTFEVGAARMPSMIRLEGPHGSQFINALVTDDHAGKQSKLVIERRVGSAESVVTEMYLAEAGLHLRYAAPKAPKELELAAKPVREEVLVALNSRK